MLEEKRMWHLTPNADEAVRTLPQVNETLQSYSWQKLWSMRGVLSGYLELSSKRAHHVGGYERSWISHGDHHIRSWQGKLSQAACEANKQEELYLKANGIMYYKATDGTVHAGRRGPSLGFSFAGHYPESAVRKVLPVDTTGNAGPGSQEPYRPFMRDFELSTAGNYGRKRDHIRKPVVQKELRELNLSASRGWTIEDREWYERHRSRLADLDLIKTRRPRRLQRRGHGTGWAPQSRGTPAGQTAR